MMLMMTSINIKHPAHGGVCIKWESCVKLGGRKLGVNELMSNGIWLLTGG